MSRDTVHTPTRDPQSGGWAWVGTLAQYIAAQPTASNADAMKRKEATRHGSGAEVTDWWGAPFRSAAQVRAAIGGKGWPEGTTWARTALPGVALPEALVARRRMLRGDWGDVVEPDRVSRGEVETCWSRSVRTARDGARPVVLVVPHGALGSVSDVTYRWRAVAPLLLWESLTAAGWNVALWTVNRGQRIGDVRARMSYAVEVCGLGEPLSADVAMCALGLSGVFRTCGFRLRASAPDLFVASTGDLGSTDHPGAGAGAEWWAAMPAVLREHVEGLGARVVVVEHASNAEEAEQATLTALRTLGVLREALR